MASLPTLADMGIPTIEVHSTLPATLTVAAPAMLPRYPDGIHLQYNPKIANATCIPTQNRNAKCQYSGQLGVAIGIALAVELPFLIAAVLAILWVERVHKREKRNRTNCVELIDVDVEEQEKDDSKD